MDSNRQTKDVAVQITKNFDNIDVDLTRLKKLVKAVCTRFTEKKRRDTKYEISIAIVNDAESKRINKQFLGRNRPTDCLSFDLSDDENRKSKIKNRKFFEVVVNGERAVKEAKTRGHSSEAELALYVTHGLLHNLGFDDSQPKNAKKIHDTENEILKQLGYNLGSVQ